MFDVIAVHAGSQKTIDKWENIKLDELLKAVAQISVLAGPRHGHEVEIGIRPHDPRANAPKT